MALLRASLRFRATTPLRSFPNFDYLFGLHSVQSALHASRRECCSLFLLEQKNRFMDVYSLLSVPNPFKISHSKLRREESLFIMLIETLWMCFPPITFIKEVCGKAFQSQHKWCFKLDLFPSRRSTRFNQKGTENIPCGSCAIR